MNTKRQRKNLTFEVKGFKVTKKNLKIIEKIILKRVKPSDFYIQIGRDEGIFRPQPLILSSARFIRIAIEKEKYIKLKSKAPNLSLIFDRGKVIMNVQRQYYKGENLKNIEECFINILAYLKTELRDTKNRE